MWRVLIFNKRAHGLKTTIRQSKAETTIRTWKLECPLSMCLWKSTGARPWVKMLSMLHHGPGQGQMDRVWRNHLGGGTQKLVLWRRLKTPVWGGIHCMERSYTIGSIISCTPITSRFISIWMSARPHNITQFSSGLCTNFRPWRQGRRKVLQAAW